jgi:hypothetical protein
MALQAITTIIIVITPMRTATTIDIDQVKVRPPASSSLLVARRMSMAIEDHPKFSDWSKALDRLAIAREEYAVARAFAPLQSLAEFGDLQALEAEVWTAMRNLHTISGEIDG